MKRLAIDLVILILVATPVTALALLMPKENMCVERNWGTVLYSPPVTRDQAEEFAEAMVTNGVFAGSPVTFNLHRDGEEWVLMMASTANYEESISREIMAIIGKDICRVDFPGQTASFVLMDKDLRPFEELVPATEFPEE